MRKIAIFASGSGTNAENIILWFSSSKLAKVTLILTENPNAFVLNRAKRLGVESRVFTMDALKEGSVLEMLKKEQIDFVVLAGFLKLVPADLVATYKGRIVNVHPALLPKYGGKGMFGHKVHSAVISAKECESGITIHYVTERYDEGNIIFQAKCSVSKDDNADSLAQKVHALEYEHYPRVIEELIIELNSLE